MKLGLVVYTTDAEVAWNAFRLGVFARKQGDEVTVFLLAGGVECESLAFGQFRVREQMQLFLEVGGQILACGTCLQMRQLGGSEMCPISTMADLYQLIRDADKIISL